MIKTGSGTSTNRIELPDPEIEKAEIVECIFDMIVNNKPFLGFRSIHFQYIIEFLQKYDFRQILEHLRTSLLLAVAEKVHPARTIIAASHLGDIKLCVRIIATAGTLRWPAHSIEDGSFGNSLRGRPLFDIRSWPLDKMESLRPSFFWALLRAPDKRTGRKDKVEEDDKAMIVEFLRLMSLEGESIPPDPMVLLTCLGAPQFT